MLLRCGLDFSCAFLLMASAIARSLSDAAMVAVNARYIRRHTS